MHSHFFLKQNLLQQDLFSWKERCWCPQHFSSFCCEFSFSLQKNYYYFGSFFSPALHKWQKNSADNDVFENALPPLEKFGVSEGKVCLWYFVRRKSIFHMHIFNRRQELLHQKEKNMSFFFMRPTLRNSWFASASLPLIIFDAFSLFTTENFYARFLSPLCFCYHICV